MEARERNSISHEEIAYLAYIAWEKAGRPQGHDVDYWLEVESQLKATKHLLNREIRAVASKHPSARHVR